MISLCELNSGTPSPEFGLDVDVEVGVVVGPLGGSEVDSIVSGTFVCRVQTLKTFVAFGNGAKNSFIHSGLKIGLVGSGFVTLAFPELSCFCSSLPNSLCSITLEQITAKMLNKITKIFMFTCVHSTNSLRMISFVETHCLYTRCVSIEFHLFYSSYSRKCRNVGHITQSKNILHSSRWKMCDYLSKNQNICRF